MLGSDARHLFPPTDDTCLDHSCYTYLNQGGFGVTPKEVIEARIHRMWQIARNPNGYVVGEAPDEVIHDCRYHWHETATMVAKRFSVEGEDVALATNVTEAVNAILRSLSFKQDDEIIFTSMGYGALINAAKHIGARQGARIVEAQIEFPSPNPDQCLDALRKAIKPGITKLAVLDHITATTALVLPIKEMTEECHKHGVAVLADGAHAPGNIAFDIKEIDADWYVANLHKWYFVPQTCAFLWRSPTRQKHQEIYPLCLSWDTFNGFPHSFAWTGTKDDTAWLSVPDAFAFMDRFGEEKVRKHNQTLIREGMALLADAWGAGADTRNEMISSMALVPMPENLPYTMDDAGRVHLQRVLQSQYRVVINPSSIYNGRFWCRMTAQIYNDVEDYRKLAKAVLSLRHAPSPL